MEQQGLARDEIAKREKEHRYQREDFSRLLRHERRIEAETPWEDAVQLLEKEPEWKEVCVCVRLCERVGVPGFSGQGWHANRQAYGDQVLTRGGGLEGML